MMQPEVSTKAILLSVRPQYANLIVDGVKKVELRRKFPIDLSPGAKCLIYSSSPTQRIIGECKIGEVKRLSIEQLWHEVGIDAMVPWSYYRSYFANTDAGCAVFLYGHIRYARPMLLTDVLGPAGRAPQSYQYLQSHQLMDI